MTTPLSLTGVPARLIAATVALLAGAPAGTAQTATLAAYYSFEASTVASGTIIEEAEGATEFDGFISGAPALECGVQGNALDFDGVSDFLTFAGPINMLFDRTDFSVSLYFHPTGINPRQTLLRKQADCESDGARLVVDYLALDGALEITFAENPSRSVTTTLPLDDTRCWYHFAMSRDNNELTFYLDGERVRRVSTGTRYNIGNDATLEVGRAACAATGTNFQGLIDELRIYRSGFSLGDAEELYLAPDRIAEVATPVINIGQELQLRVENTCGDRFSWAPAAGIVEGRDRFDPVVSPTQRTTYFVEIGYPYSGCRALDSVLIQVFDPATFDCTQLLIPSAFTPNGTGPAQNNVLGISNQATLQAFEVFEVYDRWGNRVFATGDRTAAWDGTYEGEPAMPGVYLWRVAFGCNDEALDETGSVVLIR